MEMAQVAQAEWEEERAMGEGSVEQGGPEEGEGAMEGGEEGRAAAGVRAEVLGAGEAAWVDWVGAGDSVGVWGWGVDF